MQLETINHVDRPAARTTTTTISIIIKTVEVNTVDKATHWPTIQHLLLHVVQLGWYCTYNTIYILCNSHQVTAKFMTSVTIYTGNPVHGSGTCKLCIIWGREGGIAACMMRVAIIA